MNKSRRYNQQPIKTEVHFPLSAKPDCINLVSQLLDKNVIQIVKYQPTKRPRIEEVRKYEFFQDIDFNAILNKSYPSPYQPLILHENDTRNFENVVNRLMLDA